MPNQSTIPLPSRLLLKALRLGPVPAHVAFIMDGNRRSARLAKQSVKQGHYRGSHAFKQVLEISARLSIRCISVYAFAVDNFSRPPSEIADLFQLASDQLTELCSQQALLHQYKIGIRFPGELDLLPTALREKFLKLQYEMRNYKNSVLNVCFAYSSRSEMCTVLASYLNSSPTLSGIFQPKFGKSSSLPLPNSPYTCIPQNTHTSQEIAEFLNTHMYTAGCPPLDIVLRTSGVNRLSDFFTWQASTQGAQIKIVDSLWPEFGVWEYIGFILEYQRGKMLDNIFQTPHAEDVVRQNYKKYNFCPHQDKKMPIDEDDENDSLCLQVL